MSTMSYTHPRWCDPRTCVHTVSNLDHRSAPLVWKPTAADVDVSVGLVRLDEIGDFEVTGNTNVLITVDDHETDDGPVVVDMSPAEARMWAAEIVVAAERAEVEWRGARDC